MTDNQYQIKPTAKVSISKVPTLERVLWYDYDTFDYKPFFDKEGSPVGSYKIHTGRTGENIGLSVQFAYQFTRKTIHITQISLVFAKSELPPESMWNTLLDHLIALHIKGRDKPNHKVNAQNAFNTALALTKDYLTPIRFSYDYEGSYGNSYETYFNLTK
jgi:hypothetical protein